MAFNSFSIQFWAKSNPIAKLFPKKLGKVKRVGLTRREVVTKRATRPSAVTSWGVSGRGRASSNLGGLRTPYEHGVLFKRYALIPIFL